MTKLTTSQHELLTRAADADGHAIEAPDAAKATVAALIKRGFLSSVQQAGGGSELLITEAGRALIEARAIPAPDRPHSGPAVPHTARERKPKNARPAGKIGLLVDLLGRDGGATIEALMAATGWQAHSVRGAISGAIKKALGFNVISEKTDAGRTYRMEKDGVA